MSLKIRWAWPLIAGVALFLTLIAACQTPIEEPESEIADIKSERAALAEEVKSLSEDLQVARDDVDRLEGELKAAQSSREDTFREDAEQRFQNILLRRAENLQRLADVLDQDRLLLIEIRKPVPGERDPGLRHLRNIRELVQGAGSELIAPLDKALTLAPAYYDWLERAEEDEFASLSESSVLYDLWVTPYENARQEFLEDSLLLLIKHLDEASEALTSPAVLP